MTDQPTSMRLTPGSISRFLSDHAEVEPQRAVRTGYRLFGEWSRTVDRDTTAEILGICLDIDEPGALADTLLTRYQPTPWRTP